MSNLILWLPRESYYHREAASRQTRDGHADAAGWPGLDTARGITAVVTWHFGQMHTNGLATTDFTPALTVMSPHRTSLSVVQLPDKATTVDVTEGRAPTKEQPPTFMEAPDMMHRSRLPSMANSTGT